MTYSLGTNPPRARTQGQHLTEGPTHPKSYAVRVIGSEKFRVTGLRWSLLLRAKPPRCTEIDVRGGRARVGPSHGRAGRQ